MRISTSLPDILSQTIFCHRRSDCKLMGRPLARAIRATLHSSAFTNEGRAKTHSNENIGDITRIAILPKLLRLARSFPCAFRRSRRRRTALPDKLIYRMAKCPTDSMLHYGLEEATSHGTSEWLSSLMCLVAASSRSFCSYVMSVLSASSCKAFTAPQAELL